MANYVRHWRASCNAFGTDDRFKPAHISLYVALFHFWNEERFAEPFRIFRDKVMIHARIASPTTYYRCMHELTDWGYITYHPSPVRHQTSYVTIHNLEDVKIDSAHEPTDMLSTPKNDTVDVLIDGTEMSTYNTNSINLINNVNKTKGNVNTPAHTKNYWLYDKGTAPRTNQSKKKNADAEGGGARPANCPATLEGIKAYFQTQNCPEIEAEKFYYYYQSNGWLVGGRKPMKDWQAAVRSWIDKIDTFMQPAFSQSDFHPTRQLHNANQKWRR